MFINVCSLHLLALSFSNVIPLPTKKKKLEKKKSFLCPSFFKSNSCLLVILLSIWLLQFLPVDTIMWTEPSSKHFIMTFS